MISVTKDQIASKMGGALSGISSKVTAKLDQVPRTKVAQLKELLSDVQDEDLTNIDDMVNCINDAKDQAVNDIKQAGGVAVDSSGVELSGCISADKSGVKISGDGTIKGPDAKFMKGMANDLQESVTSNLKDCVNDKLKEITSLMSKLEQLVSVDDIDGVLEAESCLAAKGSPTGLDVKLENKLKTAGLTLDGTVDFSDTGLTTDQIDKMRKLGDKQNEAQKAVREQMSIPDLPQPEF